MGDVYAELKLTNYSDIVKERDGIIQKHDIRTVTVNALVDTGTTTIVIGNNLRKKLGLMLEDTEPVTLAGGIKTYCRTTDALLVNWKNRKSTVSAWVLSNSDEVLMGTIPLQEMDLMVDPANHTLVGKHGDEVLRRL
ncbi:MAG: hypothetical protein FWD40_12310 [Treponema sp.]|nr:hypothetical protein [Treponema sp.]